ncbi:MAG: hypothetical protein LDL41_03215 [Coleofasciculus sp. S288]|nr:hypothetical protein [Coleofasciculus sp. S288]
MHPGSALEFDSRAFFFIGVYRIRLNNQIIVGAGLPIGKLCSEDTDKPAPTGVRVIELDLMAVTTYHLKPD